MKMKPFKDKNFMRRTNLINILFVFLIISILALIQKQESDQVVLSMVVTLLSGFILAIDMLMSLYIMLTELISKLKEKKVKKVLKNKGKERFTQGIDSQKMGIEDASTKILPIHFYSNKRTISKHRAQSQNHTGKMEKSKFTKRNKNRIKVKMGKSKRRISIQNLMGGKLKVFNNKKSQFKPL